MINLWRHQVEGVEHAVRHRKVALVHDTGTGKTRTAIRIADQVANRILVLCPAIATQHWAHELDQWSQIRRSVAIVRGVREALNAGVLIVPFSLVSTRAPLVVRLKAYDFDLVIIDEAHALKEPTTKRTEAVYGDGGLACSAPYVVLLTATLMPNHAAELWPHLHALRPELLAQPGYDSFIERYCETKTTWRGSTPVECIVGMKKGAPAADLKQRLMTFVHRVRKKDVQKDLPAVVIDVWPVHVADLNVPDEIMRQWRLAEAGLVRDVGPATGEEALALARASPHSATQRRLTGIIKLQAMTAVLVDELAEPGHKVIAFSYHRAVLDGLFARFAGYGVATIDGGTPSARRFALVESFRTDPGIRLFNGQINTAGEVIDLTPCSSMWIMESDWTPKTIVQAIGRANRPGQVEPLTVRMLTLEGSIDTALARTLARKARDIETIMESAP
jgi:SNF2 family DNA or RNA helicase